MFEWLLTKITGSVEIICKKRTVEDHLLVILMKLRLGLSNTDLAYRFKVSKTTISNILRSWVPVMAVVLKPLIKWPSKEAVLKNMPKIFKRNFKRCRCIIDCTEMFIARPSNLTSRAQAWWNYKHNNTIKYLIGISPAGAISFLSPGWGGRVSDKQITKESGFFKLLEPRDEVLADRGFLIRDELAAYGATLRIPHFTKGKKQLSAQEVDTSRQLSRVWGSMWNELLVGGKTLRFCKQLFQCRRLIYWMMLWLYVVPSQTSVRVLFRNELHITM